MNQNIDEKEKVIELVKSFSTAMLVTQGIASPFHARPMAIAQVEANGGLYFFSDISSPKISEVASGSEVCVTCQKDRTSSIVLYGTAHITSDSAKIKELWSEPLYAWFPEGPESASLTLIHFHPAEAEYWDNKGLNMVKYTFELAKAYVTGTRPEIEEGDQHAKLNMR